MQRQRKSQQKVLANLQNGNVVVTSGGIVGTVVAVERRYLVLRVKPDNVKIQITRELGFELSLDRRKKVAVSN